jgi:hypothetical protein
VATHTKGVAVTRKSLGWPIIAAAIVAIEILCFTSPALAAPPKVTDAKAGFSFNLPKSWQQIPLTGADVSGLIGLATKSDPSLKGVLTNDVALATKQGLDVFALGPITNGVAANINVINDSASGLPSGKLYLDEMGFQVKLVLVKGGMRNVATSTVNLPFGKQVQATYNLPTKLASQGATGLQLYVKRKSHLIIFTITGASLSIVKSAAHVIENSWHWQ